MCSHIGKASGLANLLRALPLRLARGSIEHHGLSDDLLAQFALTTEGICQSIRPAPPMDTIHSGLLETSPKVLTSPTKSTAPTEMKNVSNICNPL